MDLASLTEKMPRRRSVWLIAVAVGAFVGALGVFGASATTSRAVGGTDSTSFNNAGLPGIGFSQDSIQYNSHTHHTNLDTYERVIEQDVRDAAVIVAGTLYQLAMRDQALPRFAADKMPPAPPQRGGGH